MDPRGPRHAMAGACGIGLPADQYRVSCRPMTFAERLAGLCAERRSQVCVGLDPLPERLPEAVRDAEDPVFAFNKAIVDATIDAVPVYKPNFGFYEALGLDGLRSLKKTIDYVRGRAIVLGDA